MQLDYLSTLDLHHDSFLSYGAFIEQNGLPLSLLKVSLHIMVCQLKQQTLHRGHLAAYNELFIERAIQALKRIVDRRTTSHPEKVIVNTILTKLATANFRVQHGCPTIEELLGTGM